MSKEVLRAPVKIYWEETPKDDTQFKDVLLHGEFQEPGKLLNSTEVTVEAKPWLQKKKKSDLKGNDNMNQIKRKTRLENPLVSIRQSKPVKLKERHSSMSATLKDLRKEDKQKVANLIRELAKFGTEKEEAIRTVKSLKQDYECQLQKVQMEKEQAIKKHDSLKEKLLEYEIIVDRLYKTEKDFPDLKEVPGNRKSNSNKNIYSEISNESKNTLQTDNSESTLVDNFSELFMEQQRKFYKQQEILQDQIEQLQKLQESIVLQQSKENLMHEKSVDQTLANVPSLIQETQLSDVGLNTKKLESYIRTESATFPRQELNDDKNIPVRSITPFDKPVIFNERNIQSDKNISYSKISKHATTPKRTVDMCIQTQIFNKKDCEDQRISECEKSISTLDSLRELTNTNSKSHSMNRSSEEKHYISYIVNEQSHPTSIKTSQVKTLSTNGYPDKSSSESDDQLHNSVVKPSLSPIRRRHFQPSSILELVDGMQPRSTSTSVDQYSMRYKASFPIRKPVKQKGHTHTQKIYGKQKPSLPKRTFDDEIDEEKNILEDIFFMK